MSDRIVKIETDPDKARLLALKKKPVLTAQELTEALELIMNKMGIRDGY